MKNSQNSLSYFQLQTHAEEEEEEETKRKLRCLKTNRRIYIYINIYFFCVFSENKIAFHLLITASKVPPKGTGLISQGLRGRNLHYCFSTNEFSAALCLPPVHPLGCSRQQANLCLSLFFFSSYLSKGLSCIHFKQTNRTSPE